MAKPIDDTINEAKRKAVVERMWLSYYNDQLLKRSLITPDQHRKMRVYINGRKPSMER